ncbi:MAG: hypothetical protein EOP90_12670 [Lysobacteraceae bacterium]|nr:MAG: hypothetical protein EOP90_12670 [Xanthomonadaceae bacterium]
MNVALLVPAALFALAAVALPILLHLVRRVELHAVQFAALRWISARVPPRRRIRVERPWLLLLRVLLVTLLVVLLAEPVWKAIAPASQPRVFVAPGVERAAAQAAIGGDGAQVHWLAPGFPLLHEPMPTGAVPVASLLREADEGLAAGATLRVVVPRELGGLDGERVRLAHAVDWRIVDGRSPVGDAPARAPIRIALRHDAADTATPRWLRAAVAAWNQREPGRYLLEEATTDVPIAEGTRWLAWLSAQAPAAVDDWIARGGTALRIEQDDPRGDVLWRDAQARVLARSLAVGQGRVIAMPGALVPEALPLLLEADFPMRLLAAFEGVIAPPDRAPADAVPPLAQDAAAPRRNGTMWSGARPLDAWLALLVAALFVVERLVATAQRTGRDA